MIHYSGGIQLLMAYLPFCWCMLQCQLLWHLRCAI